MCGSESIDKIYIIDFGFTQPKSSGLAAGSEWYLSPETHSGISHVQDENDDVWSMGLSVLELEYGSNPPYPSNYASCIQSSFPDSCHKNLVMKLNDLFTANKTKYVSECSGTTVNEFKEILLKLIAYKRSDRFSSSEKVKDAFRTAYEGCDGDKSKPLEQPVIVPQSNELKVPDIDAKQNKEPINRVNNVEMPPKVQEHRLTYKPLDKPVDQEKLKPVAALNELKKIEPLNREIGKVIKNPLNPDRNVADNSPLTTLL